MGDTPERPAKFRRTALMNALKITKIGVPAGVSLPKELLEQQGTDIGGGMSVTLADWFRYHVSKR